MVRIDDFGDLNYELIAFDISGVDKTELRKRLEFDYINHLYELDHTGYFAIWNYDCQGVLKESDIYFNSDRIEYDLCKLVQTEDGWFSEFIGKRLVREDHRMM